MCLGVFMGINQDFTLSPAHAHLNLLGWVSLALYGLYHRGVARASDRLAWVQASSAAAGATLMAGGLAAYLMVHTDDFAPFIIGGSLLAIAGMALFVAQAVIDMRAGDRARSGAPAAA